MGINRSKRGYVTAFLSFFLLIIFLPGVAFSQSIEINDSIFKEAGISLQHTELLPRHTDRGSEDSVIERLLSDDRLIVGTVAGHMDPSEIEEIESNMSEEEVAGTPEDLDEEEDIPLPVDLNKRVEYAIKYFRTKASSHFRTWHKRSGKYEKLIRKILRSEGVPGDFVYLAMIESGFSTRAVSRAGAVGIWQFMYWTGKKYGLTINWWDDERRDFERSTRAAARYLKCLHDMFGSWYLAAAAYNVGEGKIDRAIRRYRTNDYWKLVKYRYLPRETKNYVPKMLAALTIVKNLETYGFEDMELDEPLRFDIVDLPGATDLRTLAEIIGVDYEEIINLNPGIRRGVSPPDFEMYAIRLPDGSKEKAQDTIEEIKKRGKVTFVLHRVNSKDNIYRIAKKYSTDIMRVKEVNGLRSNSIRGRKRLIIPIVNKSEKNAMVASLKPVSAKSLRHVVSSLERSARYYYVYRQGNRKIYLVKKGDSLYKISRRFGVSISTLRRLNGLQGNIIRPGQRLTIRVYGKAGKRAGKNKRNVYTYTIDDGKKIYTVKSGNTLYAIARAFNISLDQLKKMNGIKGEMIRPGMKLIVGYTG